MSAVVTRLEKTLVRREFWENRSLWIVPTVAVGLFTVLSVYMLVAMLLGYHGAVNGELQVGSNHFDLNALPDFAAIEPERIASLLKGLAVSLGSPLTMIMQVVVFFYLLDSLYADRRDRSVLFWRSMPVSDTHTVLSKLAAAIIASVAITFVATVAFELMLILLAQIGGAVLGVHLWVLLAHPLALIEGWTLLAYALVVSTLWFLPYYGWLMLASSWAKKAPLLWAVLPPLGIMFAEWWVLRTSHFAHLFFRHAVDWAPLAFNYDPGTHFRGDQLSLSLDPVTADSVLRYLTAPELWIGTVLAAAFIYGATWLRKNRSEI